MSEELVESVDEQRDKSLLRRIVRFDYKRESPTTFKRHEMKRGRASEQLAAGDYAGTAADDDAERGNAVAFPR